MDKVLYVASEPAPGMVHFASAVINEAAERGDDVYSIVYSDKNHPYSELIDNPVHMDEITYPSSNIWKKISHKFFAFDLYFRTCRIMKENGINRLYLLTGEYGFGLYGLSGKLDRQFELHYVVHDLEKHPDYNEPLKNRIFNSFFHRMTLRNIRNAENLETCSKLQAEELKRMFPRKKVTFRNFPSLVTRKMKEGREVCPELIGHEGYVLFWGNVGGYKGVDILCQAFRELDCPAELVIAGKGYIQSEIGGRSNIIRINRFIRDEEVGELFKNAAVVVFPYKQITMSGVLSVAHYFKTRAIVSDLPFFLDNISPSDVVFKSGDVGDLKDRLQLFIKGK